MKMTLWSVLFTSITLVSVVDTQGFEEKYLITGENFVEDKWFGSVYVQDGINDGLLKVGGWGDLYYTLIKMPVHLYVPGASRIIINKATLNLQSVGSDNPTAMRKWLVKTPWTETSTSDHWTLTINDYGSILAPPANGLYSFDIGQEYYFWLTGQQTNYGILLIPEDVNNKFNFFRSSENRPESRPYVEVFYERVPSFEIPLPGGGKAWKLTVEAGGKKYNSQTELDSFHTGNTYYSMDFSPRWVPVSGGSESIMTDVPIYAAAGGKVVGLASDVHNPNGWFVKLDHDYDGNLNTGFQTVYIHLKNQPSLSLGNVVQQGDQIGIMGTTGEDSNGIPTSTGIHLHMTFYFKNKAGTGPNGPSSSFELNSVFMGGWPLKDFKLGSTWNADLDPDQWNPVYYESSNTP